MRESGESGRPTGSDVGAAAGRSAAQRGREQDRDPGGAGRRIRTPDDLRAPDAAPMEEEVRLRAYELYQARGGAEGSELDDWVRAEKEVRGRHAGDSSQRLSDGFDDVVGRAEP
jgi:hypothetical protein